MQQYTIKFQEHDQDNLHFIPFKLGDKMPKDHYIFEDILAYSIEAGYINSENDIKAFVSESNHIGPYFTSFTAAEDCRATLDCIDAFNGVFNPTKTVYELF
jgi:hypothetical protein